MYTQLPPLRRAREYHLYAADGRRYLDLYLAGGRAILGHKPPGLMRSLKNELQKGLLAEFPAASSSCARRFVKALLGLPGLAAAETPGDGGLRVALYASFDRALAAAGRLLGRRLTENDIQEPFFARAGEIVYYRPGAGLDYSPFPLMIPVLPFPGGFAPQPLLFRPAAGMDPRLAEDEEETSPVLLAGLTRVTEELQSLTKFPDIWKEWRMPGWNKLGCYCFWEGRADYGTVFRRFRENLVILPPDPRRPALLPRVFSQGEKSLVERLCAEASAQEEQ